MAQTADNNSGTPNGDIAAFMFHYEESTADNLTPYASYMNRYGSGARTSAVTVTTDATVAGAAITTLVDGDYLGDLSKPRFAADATGNRQITFRFPAAVKITQARFFMNSPNAEGTWKWQGSISGTSWTDISTTWTLTGDFDGEHAAQGFGRQLGACTSTATTAARPMATSRHSCSITKKAPPTTSLPTPPT